MSDVKVDDKNEASTSQENKLPETDTSKDLSAPSPTLLKDVDKGGDDSDDDDDERGGIMEMIQMFLSKKLNLDDVSTPTVLTAPTVDAVVDYILSGKCKSIITMAGAGISTSAGIPDFRTPGSGLYDNLSKYDLPYPEAIFDVEYFKKNPKPFYVLAKELYPGEFCPTPSHYFIKLLLDKGLLLRHYTQNIDTLEHICGLPPDSMVEAHGTFRTSTCLGCGKKYTQEWIRDQIFADKIPICTGPCGNLVKPDIVFFHESLPSRFFNLLSSDFNKCDLLIIIGTSLTVQPFASIIDNVSSSCPRLLINRENVGEANFKQSALEGILGGSGINVNSPKNKRDVALLGECDASCLKLAEKLGWKDELNKLIEGGKKKSPEECFEEDLNKLIDGGKNSPEGSKPA